MLFRKGRIRLPPIAWQRDQKDEFPARFTRIAFKITDLGVSARMSKDSSAKPERNVGRAVGGQASNSHNLRRGET
jgi:hypothetical protein